MQQVWRKRWRNTGWIALGAITLVLLVSAIHNKNNKVCNGIEVSFNKDGSNFFIDEKGVTSILKSYSPIKGEPIGSIDIKALEERLKQDRWIANADLFFDNKQVLQVIVEEKEPVARIFTTAGSSFYIDSACRKLPLSERLSARVPMFTGFPSDKEKLSRPNSQLLVSVKNLAMFIQSDDFWKAQVEQVDIRPEGFEMIPAVGNQVVELGKDGDWQQKFDRLFSFYKEVWTKVGFEKYEKIDVQFDGQVVATIKGAKPAAIDSTKARMAYENLLTEVKKSDDDTASIPDPIEDGEKDTTIITPVVSKRVKAKNKNIASLPHAIAKAPAKKEPVKQTASKPVASSKKADAKKVPKAVMKKQ